jgi:hypothetical protein
MILRRRRGAAPAGSTALLLAFGLAFAFAPARGDAAMRVWPLGPMVKVKPTDGPPASAQAGVVLAAARNEFEPFQLVVRAEGSALSSVDVELSDLRGPRGAVLSADRAAIYLERFLTITRRSSIEGGTGEWPDALVPRVDRYAHERRNAFPFQVAAGRSQPVWLELYVPLGTPPGTYSGTVRVTAAGVAASMLPVTLRIWSFDLPSTSSLPTTFGLNGLGALKEHRGRYTNDDELRALTGIYARGALLHRLSTHGGTMAPPNGTRRADGGFDVDWTFYDGEVGPLLEGQVLGPGDPLTGARATSVELRLPTGSDAETRAALVREWVRHFKQKGWFERLYHYLWDEPRPADFASVAAGGRVLRQADPTVPTLVTTRYDRSLADVVSIWCPVVNCVDEKPGADRFCPSPGVPRDTYAGEMQKGKRLWWYQSCGSHGCDVVGGSYFTGWPSYVVDADAVAHRIMEWLTWRYRVGGELYFNTNEAYGRGVDPWSDLLMHGGNGDGTLFYPGTPERIGGRTDIPIESIRLKLIREGLEDYEYFHLLAQAGAGAFADRRVERVAEKTYRWARDPAVLEAARREMGEELDRRRPT